MNSRLLIISIFCLILLLTNADASHYRSYRRKRADCPSAGVMCLFITCLNGGQCVDDTSTTDCFRCNCVGGYTGKTCETATPVLPNGCSPGCQNGGVCNVNVCRCPADYFGTFCETKNYCAPINPCANGGRCSSTSNDFVCDCTGTGYGGARCTYLIPNNPCSSTLCLNGGQCSWDGSTMTCSCINGYQGAFCQVAPNPCSGFTCQNGGKCGLTSANTYGCICEEGYTGAQCETSILITHPCVTMPTTVCKNGGTCTTDGADYKCRCENGWTGRNCETAIATPTTCNPSPCGIHGICVEATSNGGTLAVCNCEVNWTGKYCDVDTSSCPAGYCLSGGVCRMNGNTAYCDCPALYTGPRCETQLGVTTIPPNPVLCVSNPCQNGGTCYTINSANVCQCPPNWTGATCTQYIPPVTTTTTTTTGISCYPNLCLNNGVCYNGPTGFHCQCTSGWTGVRCEISNAVTPNPTLPPINHCSSQPCKNGGQCVSTNVGYSCACPAGYAGANCEAIKATNCPLNCLPGDCIFTGSSTRPYACVCNGVMKLTSCN